MWELLRLKYLQDVQMGSPGGIWISWTAEGILGGHIDLGGTGTDKAVDGLAWK